MSALPNRSMMSVDDYLRLEYESGDLRYEYIDGLVTMLAGGTLDHATIMLNVASILRTRLRSQTCRVFSSDARVRLSESRYVYPDITISCDTRDRGKVDTIQSPRVVIEVLSPSTEDYDRGRKFNYYRACPTIQEYILVNTDFRGIEVCRREQHDLWSFHIFHAGDDLAISSIDMSFPVKAVYEDVEFA